MHMLVFGSLACEAVNFLYKHLLTIAAAYLFIQETKLFVFKYKSAWKMYIYKACIPDEFFLSTVAKCVGVSGNQVRFSIFLLSCWRTKNIKVLKFYILLQKFFINMYNISRLAGIDDTARTKHFLRNSQFLWGIVQAMFTNSDHNLYTSGFKSDAHSQLWNQ